MKISHDFVEKLTILVLTAVLTGFLVPYILKRVDEAKSKEQKLFEADVARQAKLIDAQAKFLDEITEALWHWRYLSIRVTFHADDPTEERYTAAVEDYEGKIWDVLSSLRNLISKSRRLVSEEAYKSLVSLYDRITELDSQLAQFVRTDLPRQRRIAAVADLQKTLRWEMTAKLDEVIDMLAREVGLKELRNAASGS
jgi:hypothetical protein